jgi:hypothetical protein
LVELYASIHGATPAVQGPAHEMRLLFDFESARLSGRTVAGPPPEEFFSVVPRRRLLEAADQELREWEGYSSFHQPHMAALQAARAWMLADEFALASKLAAGRWGAARWSSPALLEAAIARQRGDRGSRVDETEARELIAHAHERLRARLATEANE